MMLLQMICSWDLGRKKALTMLIMALAFGVFVYICHALFIRESIVSLMAMKQELALKKQLLRVKEEHFASRAEIEADLLEYQSDLESLSRRLIPERLVADALVKSSRLMDECGLDELELRIGEKESLSSELLGEGEELYRVSFKITGLGSYENAISYMKFLEEDDFSYELEEVRMSSKNVAAKGDVYLELQLCIYGFKDEALGLESEENQPRKGNPFYYTE